MNGVGSEEKKCWSRPRYSPSLLTMNDSQPESGRPQLAGIQEEGNSTSYPNSARFDERYPRKPVGRDQAAHFDLLGRNLTVLMRLDKGEERFPSLAIRHPLKKGPRKSYTGRIHRT